MGQMRFGSRIQQRLTSASRPSIDSRVSVLRVGVGGGALFGGDETAAGVATGTSPSSTWSVILLASLDPSHRDQADDGMAQRPNAGRSVTITTTWLGVHFTGGGVLLPLFWSCGSCTDACVTAKVASFCLALLLSRPSVGGRNKVFCSISIELEDYYY